MKNTDITDEDTDLLPEYEFDYSKAKTNRFLNYETAITVILEPDVAAVFKSSESVNTALRAFISAIPK